MSFARSVVIADKNLWETSLPDDTVTSKERAAFVDELLVDVPIPPGLNVQALQSVDRAQPGSTIMSDLTGVLMCGWLDEWINALELDDSEAVAEAVAAIESSTSWPSVSGPNVVDLVEMTSIVDLVRAGDRVAVEATRGSFGCWA
jgi:hypothetical protein